MARFCLIDFETASACDLKKAGAWRYGEDVTTEILCLGWTDGLDTNVITPDWLWYNPEAKFSRYVNDPDCIFIAHNVAFEKSIWRNIMVKQLGWPDIPNERWHDIMAACAMKGLPLKLERAAAALRLHTQKDKEGSRVTISLSKPNRKGYYDRSPEKLARVYDYNRGDLGAELEAHRRVRGLGASERRVWLLDQQINERGVRLDLDLIRASQSVVAGATKPLAAEFTQITGIEVTQVEEFKRWLLKNGCPFPKGEDGEPDTSLSKEAVTKILGDDDEEDTSLAGSDEEDFREEEPQIKLPWQFERALRIRQILGSASVKKLASMRASVCSDGRARGTTQYHGAGPGRWAGRLFQPHNFPRPTLKEVVGWKDGKEVYGGHDPDQLVAALMTGDAEYVSALFGNPIEAVSNGLRHILIPNPGNVFVCGDFKTIECRIVLALAGQWDKVDVMAKGGSPYVPMAEAIYHRKINKEVDLKEYTIGKNTILGCGFQMGGRKFHKRYCPKESLDFANEVVRVYREDECPQVPKVWKALGQAALDTVWTRKAHSAYGVTYALEDEWMTALLPSGRKLWYFQPQTSREPMPWDKNDIRPGWTYMAYKQGKSRRVKAYGGLCTENVVQALARDCLVAAMFRVNAAGYFTVLSVHDEDLSELTKALADVIAFKQMLIEREQWTASMGIPLDADCWIGDRYRK